MIEIIGYAGLLLLGVSLSKENVTSLRKWGIFSSVVFCIQGLLLNVYSLVIVNALVVSLHIYKLIKAEK